MSKYDVGLKRPPGSPREKLIEQGPDLLTNAELLANIFITGTRNEGVVDLSARCLKEYGSRSILSIRDVSKVQDVLELGLVKACQLVAVFELGRRFYKESGERMPAVRGPEDIYKLYKGMGSLKREEARAVYFNTRQRLIHEELINIGKVDKVSISVQSILQPAVELMASSFILIHNHPSGSLEVSNDDIEVTRLVQAASKIIGIRFLDHIVIGNGWRSALDQLENKITGR